jgi:hypothetical protein
MEHGALNILFSSYSGSDTIGIHEIGGSSVDGSDVERRGKE